MDNKKFSWKEVDVFVGGKKIDVKSVEYNSEPFHSEMYALSNNDLDELFKIANDREAQCNYIIGILQKKHPEAHIELTSILNHTGDEYVVHYIVNPMTK